jgi:hypothetical protein
MALPKIRCGLPVFIKTGFICLLIHFSFLISHLFRDVSPNTQAKRQITRAVPLQHVNDSGGLDAAASMRGPWNIDITQARRKENLKEESDKHA